MYGSFVCSSQYRIERGAFDSYLVIYTREGMGYIETKYGKNTCRKGDFVLIDCNSYHLYYASTYWEFDWFHFNGNCSKELTAMILQDHGNIVHVPETSIACHMVRSIVRAHQGAAIKKEVDISAQIQMILSEMVQVSQINEKKDNEWIAEAISYIHEHYAEKLTVEGLADYLSISKSSFCHTFKRKMGFSPYEFILNTRISKGKELLRNTNMSISDVSYAVGFNSEANFIKTFREKTGQTPYVFRKAHNKPSDFLDVFFGKKLYTTYTEQNE